MEVWLDELGKKTIPEKLQTGILATLNKEGEHAKYVSWLENNQVTLSQLVLLSYLINDGVVMMTNSIGDDDTEAIHIQNTFTKQELSESYLECQSRVRDDLKSFEEELNQLTLEPSASTGTG